MALTLLPKLLVSEQSIGRKFLLILEMIYVMANSVLSVLFPAAVYITCAAFITAFVQVLLPVWLDVPTTDPQLVTIEETALFYYHIIASSLLAILIGAAAWPGSFDKRVPIFIALSVIFGVMFMIAVVMMTYMFIIDPVQYLLAGMAVVGLTAIVLLGGLSNGSGKSTLLGMPVYLLALPTFTVVILTYSILNCHDLSWGTKSATKLVDVHVEGASAQAQVADDVPTPSASLARGSTSASNASIAAPEAALEQGATESATPAVVHSGSQAVRRSRMSRVAVSPAHATNSEAVASMLEEEGAQKHPVSSVLRLLPESKDVPRLDMSARKRRYRRFRNIVASTIMLANAALVIVTWLDVGLQVLIPLGIVTVFFLMAYVVIGMGVFGLQRAAQKVYRGVLQPKLVSPGQEQKGNSAYKVDAFTGKLQGSIRPTHWYANDWLWGVMHGQLTPTAVAEAIRGHNRATALAAAELYSTRRPAAAALAKLGTGTLPPGLATVQLQASYMAQTGRLVPGTEVALATRAHRNSKGDLVLAGDDFTPQGIALRRNGGALELEAAC